MLKSISLLVVSGGLAYTYLVEPAWVNWGIDKAQCWFDGGVYIRADAREKNYVTVMSHTTENRARLESGDAKGCLPEPQCVMAPTDAVAMIDRKEVSWLAKAEFYKTKLKLNALAHDGHGFDLPGDGQVSKIAAEARLTEALFCARYLEQTASTLRKALNSASPVSPSSPPPSPSSPY